MDFKYKNIKIRVVKSVAKKIKTNKNIVFCNSFLRTKNESKIRKALQDRIRAASEKGEMKLLFDKLETSTEGLPLIAIAKIMTQEVLNHIKYSKTNLKEIIFIISDKINIKLFKKTVFGYLDYIINKLSSGPFSTVDIIIETQGGIVLIERSNPPFGWALPGGFVDYGESLEEAAKREAKEETGLGVFNLKQFHTYSQPGRDPRFHTISTVFSAKAKGSPQAASDAKRAGVFNSKQIEKLKLAFDHDRIIKDFFKRKR
ncbi:MAG: NUDIX domain-containing protein [Candidatus Omnitrophota bacterium]